MEDFFDHYKKTSGWLGSGQESLASCDWTPRVDISETDTEFLIKADIPGVEKEQVIVSVEKGVLTVQGERKTEKEEKNKKFHRVERFTGTFVRRFTIPDNVDPEAIKAVFKDGMLNLHLPKTEEVERKAIDIQVE
jgi:HSP20 family protein